MVALCATSELLDRREFLFAQAVAKACVEWPRTVGKLRQLERSWGEILKYIEDASHDD